jgi:hypothetical protein
VVSYVSVEYSTLIFRGRRWPPTKLYSVTTHKISSLIRHFWSVLKVFVSSIHEFFGLLGPDDVDKHLRNIGNYLPIETPSHHKTFECSLPCSQQLPTLVSILSQINPIDGLTSYFYSSILILFFHLRRIYKWFLHFRIFRIKLYMQVSCLPHASYIPRQPHPPNADHPYNSGQEYELWSSSLCSFPPVTPSLLCTNILLFLNTHFPLPYKTAKIIAFYVFIFRFSAQCSTSHNMHNFKLMLVFQSNDNGQDMTRWN